jgi:hypothetical protein
LFENDIAVVHLERAAQLSPAVQPIDLPVGNFQAGIATSYGWGKVTADSS